jgi:hypothetical protein
MTRKVDMIRVLAGGFFTSTLRTLVEGQEAVAMGYTKLVATQTRYSFQF